MEFNKAYKREEYLSFLRVNFLPDDFQQKISSVENPVQFQYTQQVTRLGECESLGLVVYEVRHNSKHDARVGLGREEVPRLLFREAVLLRIGDAVFHDLIPDAGRIFRVLPGEFPDLHCHG